MCRMARTTHDMTRKIFLIALGCLLAFGAARTSFAGGDEVVVIYNSQMPESESLARYYAGKRDVPKDQVLGFKLPTGESISRANFRDDLQLPLAQKLERLKLWHIGSGEMPGTNGTSVQVSRKVVESKIRYAVLCYGVPLKILRDPDLRETIEESLRPELRRNEAAVDSELACLPLHYPGYPLAGPLANPFFGVTNATLLDPTNGLLMVARLDGPTPAIARSLVDKALQAEEDGLWGRAYFDLRNISDPAYKQGDDWIRSASEIARQLGFETVVEDTWDVWPAAFPMSHIALYVGWYRENVAGPFTLPAVEFVPGAFAYHLHSFSAASLRTADRNWVGPLLAKGATCTMGCVDEPYLGGTPEVGTFTGRWLYFGFTFGEAAYACQPLLSWQTTVVGDPLYRPFGRDLIVQHEELVKRKSQLAEWSTLRILNLSRLRGMGALQAATILEDTPLAKQSAVLTEKLADLYSEQGKPSSAIAAYERALTLNPSPQQRIRLRLTLGEKLVAAQRIEEARTNYQKLLQEAPDYPDVVGINQKLAAITPAAAK
jgi:uncharacterized protein (TIGR03790 family)